MISCGNQVLRGDIATGIGRVGSLNSGYQIPSKFFAEVLCDVFGIFVAVISTLICRSHNDAGLTDSLINHVIQNGNCVRSHSFIMPSGISKIKSIVTSVLCNLFGFCISSPGRNATDCFHKPANPHPGCSAIACFRRLFARVYYSILRVIRKENIEYYSSIKQKEGIV